MSMDKLFRSNDKLYISPPICLKRFLEDAIEAEDRMYNFFGFQSGVLQRTTFLKFMEEHDFNCKQADKVINDVDFNFKRIWSSNPITNFELTFPPKNSKLLTHKVLHDIRENYGTTMLKNHVVLRGKYFKYREQELRLTFTPSGTRSARDIICTVHLLAPMNRPPESFENISLRNRCEVKFLVRGDMPLIKLRNKIFCASDFWCNLEDFECVNNKEAFFSNRFPSNFIFIHDTFYIDKQINTVDISEPIRNFMDRKRNYFGPCNVKDMEKIKIIDLNLRLGQPYVFQHQGICEHLLIFTDLRILNASDEQAINEYPIRIFDTTQHKSCCACRENIAAYLITESDRMSVVPAFMCYSCFHSFHYDGQNRIGNFKAFHYSDHVGTE